MLDVYTQKYGFEKKDLSNNELYKSEYENNSFKLDQNKGRNSHRKKNFSQSDVKQKSPENNENIFDRINAKYNPYSDDHDQDQ